MTHLPTKTISYDHWYEVYHPTTYFEPRELSQSVIDGLGGGKHWWTEYDDGSISSGLQVVNRFRYIATDKSWNPEVVTLVEREEHG